MCVFNSQINSYSIKSLKKPQIENLIFLTLIYLLSRSKVNALDYKRLKIEREILLYSFLLLAEKLNERNFVNFLCQNGLKSMSSFSIACPALLIKFTENEAQEPNAKREKEMSELVRRNFFNIKLTRKVLKEQRSNSSNKKCSLQELKLKRFLYIKFFLILPHLFI